MKLVSEVQNNYLKYQLCGVAGIFLFWEWEDEIREVVLVLSQASF